MRPKPFGPFRRFEIIALLTIAQCTMLIMMYEWTQMARPVASADIAGWMASYAVACAGLGMMLHNNLTKKRRSPAWLALTVMPIVGMFVVFMLPELIETRGFAVVASEHDPNHD